MSEKKTPKSVLIASLIIILFIFQEILFRILFPLPDISNFNRINYSPLFFGNKAEEPKYLSNASFIWASDPDGTESKIDLNLYGFRGKNFDAEPNPEIPRIAFIGDSFTEGYLANEDESIPNQFKSQAKNVGKEIETLNLGIGGTDFNSHYKLLADIIPTLKPDHIFILLHANDLPPEAFTSEYFDNPLKPESSNKFLPRFVVVLNNWLAGRTIPKIWLSSPFTFFAPVPAPSNPWSNTEKAEKYKKFVSEKVATAMQKGRFNPFSVDEYTQFKEHLPLKFKITEHLNGIQNYVAQYGKKIYIAYIPSRNQVTDYYIKYQKEFSSDSSLVPLTGDEYQVHAQIMESSCKSLGIPFLNLTGIVKDEESKGNHLYWNYDEHMKAKGYSLIAKNLYNWWKVVKNNQ